MFWAIYYNVLMAGFLREHEPVLFSLKHKSQAQQSYSMRFDYKLTQITRLALQMFMVSLELVMNYNLTGHLTSHPHL